MNVALLQIFDRWAGVPVCCLLTLFRRLAELFGSGCPRNPKSILLIKLAEQGSTVLAYDAFVRAAESVGRENLYCLVFQENRSILDTFGVISEENVITISHQSLWSLLRTACHAVLEIRRRKISTAVDLEFFARGSAILAFLSGAKCRVGFHAYFGAGPYRGDLLTHRLLYNSHLHTSEAFRSLVDAATSNPPELPALPAAPPDLKDPPIFSPSVEEKQQVASMLGCAPLSLPPIVLLNPNAGDLLPLRRWPARNYVDLARVIIDSYPEVNVVFTGSDQEASAVAALATAVDRKRCRCLAGKTSMRHLLTLYCASRVLVTNDSGPAHFASLTPIRVVALFGPETPALFAPRNSRTNALWARLACSPCVNAYNNRQTSCRNNLCMQAISTDQVFSAVRSALSAGGDLATSPRIAQETLRC